MIGCDVWLPSVWQDNDTGLMWENPSSQEELGLPEAWSYCEELILYGYDDWRLPNISELRSLVRGCSNACSVSTECASSDYDSYCSSGCNDTCYYDEGPGEGGCFWNEALQGNCASYWSSTADSSDYYYSDGTFQFWTVDFRDSEVDERFDDNINTQDVRCVRGAELLDWRGF